MEKTGQGEQGPFMDCLTLIVASVSLFSELISQELPT